jgi:hypothetical protein
MGKNISAQKTVIGALIFSFLVLPVFAKAQADVHLRIEGENSNICDTNVTAETALDAVVQGAGICGDYTYDIKEYGDLGQYLNKINAEAAHGSMGWLYFVNYQMPMEGAGSHVLSSGDEVLWYFGDFDWKPAKLTLTNTEFEAGKNLQAKVEYFEDSSWKPLAGAVIHADSQIFTTDAEGKVDSAINNVGTYQVFAEKSGYIRSNRSSVNVVSPPVSEVPIFGGGGSSPSPTPESTPTSTATSTPEAAPTSTLEVATNSTPAAAATSTPETAATSTAMVAGAETNAQVESLQVKIAQFQTQIAKIAELQAQLTQLLQQLIQELQAQVLQLQS